MPIDSSIYSQFAPAAKSVRDFQDEDLMREARRQGIASNQLVMLSQRQKLDEYQRGVREQETVRNALAGLGSGATDDQRIAALKGTGLASGFTQADALQTSLLNRGKTEAETRAKQAESLGKLLSAQGDLATRVFANPTREAAASALANMKSLSQALGIPLDFAGDDAALQQFQTPEQIKAWAAGHAMKAQELLPKIQTLNVGNAQVTQAVDPLTGKPTQTGRMAIAQSPDNAATVGASLANAAAVRDAAKVQADAARDSARIKRDQDTEMKLADDYRAQSKEFKDSKSAHEQLTATLGSATTSPAATLAAATKFMKILDPGSVVRESELGMALAASGVIDRAMNYVSTLQSGQKLTKTQAEDFKKISNQMFQAAQRVQQTIDADYKTKAKTYGLRPEMVTQDLGQNANVVDWGSLK